MKNAENLTINLDEMVIGRMEVEKISDDKFNGKHPNAINEGYKKQGMVMLFKVGYPLVMGGLRTSDITEIDEEKGIFKTENSTYRFKWLNKS